MKNITLSTSSIEENRKYWLNQSFVDSELEKAIIEAHIMLIPFVNFRDTESFSFTHETENLYDYLSKKIPSDYSVIVCAGSEFQVIALHADVKRLGNIFVAYVVAPLAINLLSSYIDEHYLSSATPASIQNTVIVNTIINVEVSDSNIVSMQYEGPAEDFKKFMNQKWQELNASE